MNLHSGGYLTFYMPGRKKNLAVSLPEPRRLDEILEELGIPLAEVDLVAVNRILAGLDALVSDTDDVHIYSSVNGG